MKKLNKKGFTLAELLIVIAIIAVLIAIAIPTFSGALDNARRQTDHANIRSAYSVMQIAKLTGQIEGADAEVGSYVMQKDGSFTKDAADGYKLKANGNAATCPDCAGCDGYTASPATGASSHTKDRLIKIVVTAAADGTLTYELSLL